MITFLDVETIPSGELPTTEWMLENHPKTMSKKETIQAWAESAENKTTIHRKKALDYLQAQIIVVCACFDDTDIVTFAGDDEKTILEGFDKWLGELPTNTPLYTTGICGHNVGFDMTMLFVRSVKYGLSNIKDLTQRKPFDDAVFDTMKQMYPSLRNEYVSMDALCEYFGLPVKGEINGSNVYDFYLKGELLKIAEYCKSDVEKTRTLYNKLK